MYVIVSRTGFCHYYVRSVTDSCLRYVANRDLAARFRSSDATRAYLRSGEQLEWAGS